MQNRDKRTLLIVLFCLFLLFPSFVKAENKMVINEFLAHSSTGNKEWVEFHNPDKVDLSSSYIDDDTSFTDGTRTSGKKSLVNLIASTSAYPYIELNSFLNNGGDHIILFDTTGNIIDQYEYGDDPGTDMTIGRSPDGIGEFQILVSATQGNANSGPQPTPTDEPTNTPTPKSPSISPAKTPSLSPAKIASTAAKPTAILGLSISSATIKPSLQKSPPKSKILINSSKDTKSPFLIICIGMQLYLSPVLYYFS
jgi:hypothetical protein